MASGVPDTSIWTIPQKHSPLCVIATPSLTRWAVGIWYLRPKDAARVPVPTLRKHHYLGSFMSFLLCLQSSKDEALPPCHRPLIEIDRYSERLIGCIGYN